MGALRCAFLDIRLLNATVNFRVLAVRRTIPPNLCFIIVGRVADDDADGLFVLLLDAYPVLFRQAAPG